MKKPKINSITFAGEKELNQFELRIRADERKKVLKIIDDLYDYYKTKLNTKAQIPLIKLKEEIKGENK